jgi:hypothetical protein
MQPTPTAASLATLANTAPPRGLVLCLVRAKLVHIPQAAQSPLPASPAPLGRSRTPQDSRHARHAFPACIARLWDSAIQLAPVEQDLTLWAVPRPSPAPVAASALFSLIQGKSRVYPAVQACIAQHQVLPSKPESVQLVLTPKGLHHLRHAPLANPVLSRIKRAKACACSAMRGHFAVALVLQPSVACALRDRFHLAAPALLAAPLAPQASTVKLRG